MTNFYVTWERMILKERLELCTRFHGTVGLCALQSPRHLLWRQKKIMPNEWCESGNQFSNQKLTQHYRIPSQNGAGGAKSNHLHSSCPIWSTVPLLLPSPSLIAATQCLSKFGLSARYLMWLISEPWPSDWKSSNQSICSAITFAETWRSAGLEEHFSLI